MTTFPTFIVFKIRKPECIRLAPSQSTQPRLPPCPTPTEEFQVAWGYSINKREQPEWFTCSVTEGYTTLLQLHCNTVDRRDRRVRARWFDAPMPNSM